VEWVILGMQIDPKAY